MVTSVVNKHKKGRGGPFADRPSLMAGGESSWIVGPLPATVRTRRGISSTTCP